MERTLPKPGFWMAVVLSLMVVASQTVLSIPLAFVDMLMESGFHLPPLRLSSNPWMISFVNLVGFGGVIALGLCLNRLALGKAFPVIRITAGQVLGIVITILGGGVLLSEADNLFRAIAPPPQALLDVLKDLFTDQGSLTGRVFLLVLVAPVTEELLFRGVVLRGLLSRHRPTVAVIVTALLFALVHVNPWQFISAFFFGIVFGWVYLRTESVWACVLAHAVANGMGVVVGALPIDIPGFTGTPDLTKAEFQPWWLNLTGLLLLLAGITIFRRTTAATPPGPDTFHPPAPPEMESPVSIGPAPR